MLGWRRTFDREDEVVLEPPAGSPEDQQVEVDRIVGLGARRVSVGQGHDVTWEVLADPEGNEFCVLRALTVEELAE